MSYSASGYRKWLWPVILGLVTVICLALVVQFSRQTTGKGISVLGEDSSNTRAMESLKVGYEKAAGIAVQYYEFPLGVLGAKANQDLANHTGLYDIIMQYNF